jgi:hypothetical protein
LSNVDALCIFISCGFGIGVIVCSVRNYIYYKFIRINECIIPINDMTTAEIETTEIIETTAIEIKL